MKTAKVRAITGFVLLVWTLAAFAATTKCDPYMRKGYVIEYCGYCFYHERRPWTTFVTQAQIASNIDSAQMKKELAQADMELRIATTAKWESEALKKVIASNHDGFPRY